MQQLFLRLPPHLYGLRVRRRVGNRVIDPLHAISFFRFEVSSQSTTPAVRPSSPALDEGSRDVLMDGLDGCASPPIGPSRPINPASRQESATPPPWVPPTGQSRRHAADELDWRVQSKFLFLLARGVALHAFIGCARKLPPI